MNVGFWARADKVRYLFRGKAALRQGCVERRLLTRWGRSSAVSRRLDDAEVLARS